MRRGMVDDIRMISCKHGFKTFAVSDGAYEHLDIDFRMSAQKLVLDIISVVLIDIENYELVRRMLRYLTAELTAYRSAAARDENRLSTDIVHDRIELYLYRRTAEKVFYIDGTDI